jgi:hypothetical protein
MIRHNRCYIAIEQNSIVISTTDLLFENNLVAGGSYCINPENSGTNKIINNHFSTKFFPQCGIFGPFYPDFIATECYGNVWHETGEPLDCPN